MSKVNFLPAYHAGARGATTLSKALVHQTELK
jgi:hypothetical protein